jgi:hypothetical protein
VNGKGFVTIGLLTGWQNLYIFMIIEILGSGLCEGAGELVNTREPAHRTRPKAEDLTKEREKFVCATKLHKR